MRIKEGDKVGFKNVMSQPDFSVIGEVLDVYPDGIPSCKQPMVVIHGQTGVVLESHCTLLERIECPTNCGGCSCHISPPCNHCVEHVKVAA